MTLSVTEPGDSNLSDATACLRHRRDEVSLVHSRAVVTKLVAVSDMHDI